MLQELEVEGGREEKIKYFINWEAPFMSVMDLKTAYRICFQNMVFIEQISEDEMVVWLQNCSKIFDGQMPYLLSKLNWHGQDFYFRSCREYKYVTICLPKKFLRLLYKSVKNIKVPLPLW